MNQYKFSPSTKGFYPVFLLDEYQDRKELPGDLIDISDELYEQYSSESPVGKVRGCDSSGFPSWVNIPAITKDEEIKKATSARNNHLKLATEAIAPLQDAVDLEIATDDEIAQLKAWKKYRVMLNRVDVSTAPDMKWPSVPTLNNQSVV